MELTELRVRNYRTIGAEQTLKLATGTTLVGPNNSGKTNLLRCVQIFFTGYENLAGYNRSVDLTFGAGSQRTSLNASFDLDPAADFDSEVLDLLDELHSIVETSRESDQVNVSLYFTGPSDTPVYRVFGNQKIPTGSAPDFSRKQKRLVELLLSRYRCHYVPSAKSIGGLYADLLQPFLTEVAYTAIEPHLQAVREQLASVSDSLNGQLERVGLDGIKATFGFDSSSPERLFSGFELMLEDPGITPLSEKGQGIQSTALFASFVWITERERASGLIPIWLIEEPESYLHPELTKSCQRLLENLAAVTPVILITHSLGFVPRDVDIVQGVSLENDRTVVSSFPSHREATTRIRNSLGVEFSDYYNLGSFNIFTEGPSDVTLIKWAITLLDPDKDRFPRIYSSYIEDFGGVKQLEGFLKAVFEFIAAERAVVAVFDGDDAGIKSRRALQQYLSSKGVQFQPNREFVSVRAGFAIEGLFPDEWITEIQAEHPGWFDEYSVDASGALEPFRIKDNSKNQCQNDLRARAEAESDNAWGTRWTEALTAIEASLERQASGFGF